MNESETQTTELEQPSSEALYLEQATSLREEVGAAMRSISENSLRDLEESIWRQQVLCASLRRLLQLLHREALSSESMSRLQSVTTGLKDLTSTYANSVRQASTHASVLYTLCRSYNHGSTADTYGSPSMRPLMQRGPDHV